MANIINLTAAEVVSIRASHVPEFIGIKTQEEIRIGCNEIGIILGKKRHMLVGAFCQPGIVHPGWSGKLEPFFIVYGRWTITVGEPIAHLLVCKGGSYD